MVFYQISITWLVLRLNFQGVRRTEEGHAAFEIGKIHLLFADGLENGVTMTLAMELDNEATRVLRSASRQAHVGILWGDSK